MNADTCGEDKCIVIGSIVAQAIVYMSVGELSHFESSHIACC